MRRSGTIARPNTSQPLDEGPAAPLPPHPLAASRRANVNLSGTYPQHTLWIRDPNPTAFLRTHTIELKKIITY